MKAASLRFLTTVVLILLAIPCLAQQSEPTSIQPERVIQSGRVLGEAIALSPDGSLVVNSSMPWRRGGDIDVWRTDGRLLRTMESGFTSFIRSVSFSRDGKRIAVSGGDTQDNRCGVEIWDLQGSLERRIVAPEFHTFAKGVFDPASSQLAICGTDKKGRNSITLWSPEGERARDIPLPAGPSPFDIKYSPDGKKIFCQLDNARIACIDAASGKTDFIIDERALAKEASIAGFDIGAGPATLAVSVSTPADLKVESATRATEGRRCTVKLYSTSGKPAGSFEPAYSVGQEIPVREVALLPDGSILVCVNKRTDTDRGTFWETRYDYALLLHDREGRLLKTLAEGPGFGGMADVNDRGDFAAIAGLSIQTWTGGKRSGRIDFTYAYRTQLSVSPDGRHFLSARIPVELWSSEGNLVRSFTFPENRLLTAVSFTPEGKIACVFLDGWDILSPDGTLVEHFDAPERWKGEIMTDGKRVYAPVTDATSMLWDIGKRSAVDLQRFIGAGAWSPNGSYLAFSSFSDRCIAVYDTAGRAVGRIPDLDTVSPPAISSQGMLAWITSSSKTGVYALHLSPIGGGASTVSEFPAEWELYYYILEFSPDGRMLAVAHRDEKAILLYDSAGKLLRRLEGLKAGVSSFAFTPDGGRLVCASFDNSIRVWNLGTDRLAPPKLRLKQSP